MDTRNLLEGGGKEMSQGFGPLPELILEGFMPAQVLPGFSHDYDHFHPNLKKSPVCPVVHEERLTRRLYHDNEDCTEGMSVPHAVQETRFLGRR